MRFLKYLFYTVLLLCIVLVVVGLFLPARTHVERTVVVEAEPQTVYGLINDFREVNRWSPWMQNDPEMKVEYSGPESGLGAVMTWQGDESSSGTGRQEIVAAEPPSHVEVALTFGDAVTATSTYHLEPVEQGTQVIWSFDAAHGLNLFQRYAGLLFDEMIGRSFEQGLTNLKTLAESLPAIITKEISYSAGGANLTGYLAMPRNAENRPGVLVVHEWWGHNDYVRERAEMLAELGYVAFALDMYGDGKQADHPQDAQKFMMEVVSNQELAKARFEAALALLKSQPQVNPEQTAAIGYCFGGGVVLSMARAGADLDGVVSFHGALGNLPPIAENAEARVLVLHGAADPFVTEEQEQQFRETMDAAGMEYQFVEYEGAKHAFTNPAATEMGRQFDLPLEYNAEADADSWQRMRQFLAEIFGQNFSGT